MNLKEIRNELRKLSALAEGWTSLQEIAPVERDMALEKLRDLYEALRFSLVPRPVVGRVLPQRAASEAPHGRSRVVRGVRSASFDDEDSEFEMVDLSEVLSLGEEEPEVPAEPRTAAESAARHAAAVEEDFDEGPEIIEFEPEPEHSRPLHRPVRQPEPEVPAEEFSEEPPVAVQSAPKPFVEPKAPVRQAPAAEGPVRQPRSAQPFAAQPSAARPIAAEEPQPFRTSQPETADASPARLSEPISEPAPTLFGAEDEETMRHRHKQRVIRALYEPDPEPAAAPKPAAAANEPFVEIEEPALPRQEADPIVEPRPAIPEQPHTVVLERPQAAAEPEAEIVLLDALTEEPVAKSRGEHRPSNSETAGEHAPQVLGEVINHDVQTLADTIAPLGGGSGRYAAPISDLRQAIGINDKFLMIRDLFGGDGALFDSTVEALNAQESLDDCMIYIAEHFAWNPESDSAALLMELLERKFA